MSEPSEAAIREAMRGVIDPELRRDVVELGHARRRSRSTAATCAIEIVLTVPGCPLKQNLEGQVRHHVVDRTRRRQRPGALLAHERGAAQRARRS